MWDRLFLNCSAATLDPRIDAAYGALEDAALAVNAGKIAWIGPRADLTGPPESLARETVDLGGGWLTPGLIDCHTHLVFAGTRAKEFELRLKGASYEDIAKSGGGILSTVRATRAASVDDLVNASRPRLHALMHGGVTTVEIKSGYGLDPASEENMLEAATHLGREEKIRVRRSFLGLHAVPPEFKDDRAGYVRVMCDEVFPSLAAKGLVDAVDAFCEGIGFTAQEVDTLFKAAKRLDLPIKLHAEQLSDLGGAGLAARYHALSADHLEYISEESITAMAKAGSVAVLLPGAFYALRETQVPPVEKFRAAGVPLAIATDLNPGSSPALSPTLIMNMAATLFRMTPEECLAGMTREAAKALGLDTDLGTLAAGKVADLCHWDIEHPAELSYWIGHPGPARRFVNGEEAIAP